MQNICKRKPNPIAVHILILNLHNPIITPYNPNPNANPNRNPNPKPKPYSPEPNPNPTLIQTLTLINFSALPCIVHSTALFVQH